MINLRMHKCNWLSVLLCMALIIIASGCTTQSSDIKTTDTGAQPGTGEPSSCLTPREAMNSVGKTACVEFYVGNPVQFNGDVFLNEMADYTKGFGATILADSVAKFGDPTSQFKYKTIRVTGQIVIYDGHPGIVVSEPTDITVVR